MYVYQMSEPGLFTVGFYDPQGQWHSDSYHTNRDDAAKRAAWLNGSAGEKPASPAMTQELHDKLIFVGYTNGYQVLYAAQDEGAIYSDTDNNCEIPVYMLKVHAHRIESTSGMNVSLDRVISARKQNKGAA